MWSVHHAPGRAQLDLFPTRSSSGKIEATGGSGNLTNNRRYAIRDIRYDSV